MNRSITERVRATKESFEHTDWKEKLARVGHAAKGAVYAIAGVLTFLAAVHLGGEKSGKMQVLKFLKEQPFGNVLLILMAIGLASYAFFRFIQVAGKSESLEKEYSKKRKAKKTGFFMSGVFYLVFAGVAVMQVFSSGGGSGSSKQGYFSQILSHSWGPVFIYIVAALLLIKAISQFYKVYKGEYFKNVRSSHISQSKARSIVKNTGRAGLISRGILIAITAYFFFQAAWLHDASEVKGSSGAFSFLQESAFGPWLVAIVAAGLVCYGIYMFIVARYKEFHIR